ncbi:MAG: V-type ATP synthase subunit E family protein [Phycisphaerae bacterium]
MTQDQANPPLAESPQQADVLREEILADARHQAERTLRRAKRDAENLVKQAQAGADKARQERLAAARTEAERRHNLILAAIPIEEARMRAARIEDILNRVREEARKRLLARDGFDYRETVIRLAAEAISRMAGKRFVLELAERDLGDLGDTLAGEVRRRSDRDELEISVAPEPAKIEGGVVVRDVEGRQVWDDSLAARLERLWPAARRAVASRLFPDEAQAADNACRGRSSKEP